MITVMLKDQPDRQVAGETWIIDPNGYLTISLGTQAVAEFAPGWVGVADQNSLEGETGT